MSQAKIGAPQSVTLNQVINIPNHYFNGFQLGLTNSDISLLIMNNGGPQAHLNMSYTTAKSLMVMLTDSIERLEKATDHKLMTTEYIEGKLSKFDPKA